MSTQQPAGGEMKVITISRQYGSGGGEIGARLAKRLNWHLIDHEIVARVARELGIPEQQAEVQAEYAKGFIARVVSQFVSPVPVAASPVVQVVPDDRADQDRYQETLRRVVEAAADSGRAVIIGRASQIFLARRRDVLHALSLPPEALGPARGLARYPGQPADIRPPERLIDTQPDA